MRPAKVLIAAETLGTTGVKLTMAPTCQEIRALVQKGRQIPYSYALALDTVAELYKEQDDTKRGFPWRWLALLMVGAKHLTTKGERPEIALLIQDDGEGGATVAVTPELPIAKQFTPAQTVISKLARTLRVDPTRRILPASSNLIAPTDLSGN